MAGTTQISAPAPTQPSVASDVSQWASALPQIYAAQAQYAPQEAQQQVQIAQQTDLPMAQAAQQAQQALYPQVANLSENLATIANQNMSGQVPAWMKQQYQSDMNAQLGQNANSGIGADYMSRGLMQQNQNWQQYYQGLGSSVAAGMPMVQPQSAGYSNYMSGFSPTGVGQLNNQSYGSAGSIYGSQLGYNSAANSAMMNLIGSGIGAAGNVASSAAMPKL
jgi:hypothetical protein